MKPEEFKVLRLAHGLEILDFANRLGVSRAAVRQWEEGTRRPRPAMLLKIQRFYARMDGCRCLCHGKEAFTRPGPWSEQDEQVIREVIEKGGTPQDVLPLLSRERTLLAIGRHAWRMGLVFDTPVKLSTTQAAKRLGVSVWTMQYLVISQKIPAERYVSQYTGKPMQWWRIRVEDLEAYQQQQRDTHVG